MSSQHPPEDYLDGCTYGPSGFGDVSHLDVCHEHDLDWWYKRTLVGKIVADAKWAGAIIARHLTNWPWQPLAILYAVFGFIGLSTVGIPFWMGLIGPGRRMRK